MVRGMPICGGLLRGTLLYSGHVLFSVSLFSFFFFVLRWNSKRSRVGSDLSTTKDNKDNWAMGIISVRLGSLRLG